MEDQLQMGRSTAIVDPVTTAMMDDMECEQLGDLGAKNVKSQDST